MFLFTRVFSIQTLWLRSISSTLKCLCAKLKSQYKFVDISFIVNYVFLCTLLGLTLGLRGGIFK